MLEKILTILSVALVGAFVALGKLLVSKDRLTLRTILGRGILGAALGVMAYPAVWLLTALTPLPGALELQIIIGVCCALAAAGTELLEKLIDAVVEKWKGK